MWLSHQIYWSSQGNLLMVYSHCIGTGPTMEPGAVAVSMGFNILCRNVPTGLGQEQAPGPIGSYSASTIPCTMYRARYQSCAIWVTPLSDGSYTLHRTGTGTRTRTGTGTREMGMEPVGPRSHSLPLCDVYSECIIQKPIIPGPSPVQCMWVISLRSVENLETKMSPWNGND